MDNTIDPRILDQLGLGRDPGRPTGRGDLGQHDFLKLMLTQLNNQDPMSPMESGDFLGQLAQFGTVSGISELKGSVESMSRSFGGNAALQAASLVDRNVLAPAREAWLPPDGVLEGAVSLPTGVADPILEVLDLRGQLVARVPVESTGNGDATFRWDGTLPDGSKAPAGFYELRALGTYDGETEALEVLVSGRVESVALGGRDGAVDLTVTGLGTIGLDRIRRVS
jgi:flagellar basal-body rod modification protein FlgD